MLFYYYCGFICIKNRGSFLLVQDYKYGEQEPYAGPGFRAAQASGWPGLEFWLIHNFLHELFNA